MVAIGQSGVQSCIMTGVLTHKCMNWMSVLYLKILSNHDDAWMSNYNRIKGSLLCSLNSLSVFNPLMPTASKSSPNNIKNSLQAKAKLGKCLMEKCLSEHHLRLSFKHFVKPFLIWKVLSTATVNPYDDFWRNLHR